MFFLGKRSKRKLNTEEILNRDHYRSILYLSLQWRHKKGVKNGFRQEHYRYVLIKNHDNIKNTPLAKEMESIFGKSLDFGGYRDYWVKECITSRSGLSNFLDYLVERKLLIPNKDNNNVTRYKITKKGRMSLYHFFIVKETRDMNELKLRKLVEQFFPEEK